MSKHRKKHREIRPQGSVPPSPPPPRRLGRGPWLVLLAVAFVVGIICVALLVNRNPSPAGQTNAIGGAVEKMTSVVAAAAAPVSSSAPPVASSTAAPPRQATASATNTLPVMEINKAVMVTVELDFGPVVPSIADAIPQVERRSQPDDGVGRTFAILDAYGGPTPDGKKLHLSMHVSTEKPGLGELVFKRTGEVLWKSRIVADTNPPSVTGKNLLILVDDGQGRTFTVDGSNNPASILDAMIKEMGIPVSMFWPNGAEREVTFIYSSCGCPVKVMVRRMNDRTERTKDTPVIFPDDPAVVTLISRLMRW